MDGGYDVCASIAPSAIQWAASDDAGVVAGDLLSDSRTSGNVGDVRLEARIGSASCAAYATVYGPVPNGSGRLVLIDANAGLPITDALVGWSDGRNGSWLGGATGGGDALGEYALGTPPDLEGGTLLLDVLDEHYGYLSIVVPPGGLPPDAIAFLPQSPPYVPVAGGVGGDFAGEPGILDPDAGMPPGERGYLHAGFAGTALSMDPLPLSLAALLGPLRPVKVNFGGPIEMQVPISTEFGFGDTQFTCAYAALAPAGGSGSAQSTSWTSGRPSCRAGRRAASRSRTGPRGRSGGMSSAVSRAITATGRSTS